MGRRKNRVVTVHSEKAAIVMEGEVVEKWIEGGQKC